MKEIMKDLLDREIKLFHWSKLIIQQGKSITAAICLLIWVSIAGQAISNTMTNRLSVIYENRLRNAMNTYFEPSSFYINANVEINDHFFSDTLDALEAFSPVNNNLSLPGLPFLHNNIIRGPEDQTASDAEASLTEVYYNVNKVIVTLYVDPDILETERKFMQSIAMMSLKLQPGRGDEVRIVEMTFPERKDKNSTIVAINEIDKPSFHDMPDKATGGNIYFYIFIGCILILLFVLFFAFKINPNNKNPGRNQRLNWKRTHPDNIIKDDFDLKEKKSEQSKNTFHDDFIYVIGLFTDRPMELAHLFESWISSDDHMGILKIARLINSIGPRYIMLVENYLSSHCYELLKNSLNEPEAKVAVIESSELRKFAKHLRLALEPGSPYGICDLRFIHFADNKHILSCTTKLSVRELAILICHMKNSQSAWLLQQIDDKISGEVLRVSVGLQYIDYDEIKKLATKLFNKYVLNNRNSLHGRTQLRKIIQILEDIPVLQQSRYLKIIHNSDPLLYKSVTKHLIRWEAIGDTEENMLVNALSEIDSKTIALALAGNDQSLKSKILSRRTKRERIVIEELIKENDTESDEKIEIARRTLIKAVKTQIKSDNNL